MLDASYLAPTGKLIVGTVHDCDPKRIERQLKFYDKQLYLKWNPKKRGGWGMWEVRRKPEYLSSVYHGHWNGHGIYTAEYKESDIIHHVLDVPILTDELLGKLKRMDTWNSKDWVSEMDEKAAVHKAKVEADARAELQYNLRQHRREWKELASLVQQGIPLGQVLKGIRG